MLASHLPKARFIAGDISPKALAVTRQYWKLILSIRIELREGDLLSCVTEPIDLLVSNPPYIADDAPLESNLVWAIKSPFRGWNWRWDYTWFIGWSDCTIIRVCLWNGVRSTYPKCRNISNHFRYNRWNFTRFSLVGSGICIKGFICIEKLFSISRIFIDCYDRWRGFVLGAFVAAVVFIQSLSLFHCRAGSRVS